MTRVKNGFTRLPNGAGLSTGAARTRAFAASGNAYRIGSSEKLGGKTLFAPLHLIGLERMIVGNGPVGRAR